MPTLRLFTALELSPEVRRQLADLSATLSAALPRGSVRWVRPESMHLTLKFYGEVDAGKLPDLRAGLEQAAAGAAPLALALGEPGAFPNLAQPRVIWVGLEGDLDGLSALQRVVEAASAPLGFKPEARGFTPHLTLGRVSDRWRPADKPKLADALARLGRGPRGAFTAETLCLIRSDLRPAGPVYTGLAAARLARPANLK